MADDMIMVPRSALEFVMEHADFTDEGPYNEGWRSAEMKQATNALADALSRAAQGWNATQRELEIIELYKEVSRLRNENSELANRVVAQSTRMDKANYKVGYWLSAALEDPTVCDQMKADINEWFEAAQPGLVMDRSAISSTDGA